MKHRIAGKKLNRSSKHRKALFKNLLASLFLNHELTTTETKAKVIKRLSDKFITKAKVGDLHHRRQIHSFFNNKQVTHTLVDVLAPQMKNRTSGFTKIAKLGERRGDNTAMARLTFSDPIVKTETLEPKAAKSTKKTTKETKST